VNEEFLKDIWGPSEIEVAPSGVTWNALKMAQYFQNELFKQHWCKGFAMVNVRALSSALSKWRTQGKTSEQVTALIDTYMSDASVRGQNPGWQDFLYRAEKISARVPETRQKTKMELLEEAYEVGTLEAFELAFPGKPKEAAKYYATYKEELHEQD
jgi:hypothetical protein